MAVSSKNNDLFWELFFYQFDAFAYLKNIKNSDNTILYQILAKYLVYSKDNSVV